MFSRGFKINLLVRRIQKGVRREESAAALYKLLHPGVARFFRRLGFSSDECLDLIQEVFMRVYTSIDDFAGRSSFTTWVQEIALNVYRNEIRKRRAVKRDKVEISIDAKNPGDPDDSPLTIAAPGPSPLDHLIDEQRLEIVRTLVEGMPEQMQTCFRLRHDHGYKYQEIADLMKISIQTVKAHLHQARERLKRLLPNLGMNEPEE
jgi:RNA polymerase sigma-70 factor (ECF subfamily)